MSPKTYYLSLTFVNNGKETAIVQWVEPGGRKVFLDVYPSSQKIQESVFPSITTPAPIQITAVSKENNTTLLLDSKNIVSVTPKDSKEMLTIQIGEGMSSYLLKMT